MFISDFPAGSAIFDFEKKFGAQFFSQDEIPTNLCFKSKKPPHHYYAM
jgi:hypothetical protein